MTQCKKPLTKSAKLRELVRRPVAEIFVRARNWAEMQLEAPAPVKLGAVAAMGYLHQQLAQLLPAYAPLGFSEELGVVRRQIVERRAALAKEANLGESHDGSSILGEVVYSITRGLLPCRVLETGVAHGITSCHVLSALDKNGKGTLDSIDLPPLVDPGVEDRVGALIPPGIRGRWTLHRGSSRSLLKPVCSQAGAVDLFIHDSLHTQATMLFEFRTVLPYLQRPGVIVSDDVGLNRAFEDFVETSKPSLHAILDRGGNSGQIGVCVFS